MKRRLEMAHHIASFSLIAISLHLPRNASLVPLQQNIPRKCGQHKWPSANWPLWIYVHNIGTSRCFQSNDHAMLYGLSLFELASRTRERARINVESIMMTSSMQFSQIASGNSVQPKTMASAPCLRKCSMPSSI
jgi:hypothetical protein